MPKVKMGIPQKFVAVGEEKAELHKAGKIVDVPQVVYDNYKHIDGLYLPVEEKLEPQKAADKKTK